MCSVFFNIVYIRKEIYMELINPGTNGGGGTSRCATEALYPPHTGGDNDGGGNNCPHLCVCPLFVACFTPPDED